MRYSNIEILRIGLTFVTESAYVFEYIVFSGLSTFASVYVFYDIFVSVLASLSSIASIGGSISGVCSCCKACAGSVATICLGCFTSVAIDFSGTWTFESVSTGINIGSGKWTGLIWVGAYLVATGIYLGETRIDLVGGGADLVGGGSDLVGGGVGGSNF